jgi:hypothetical protein
MKTMQKVVSTPRIAMRGVANQRGSKRGSLFGPLISGRGRDHHFGQLGPKTMTFDVQIMGIVILTKSDKRWSKVVKMRVRKQTPLKSRKKWVIQKSRVRPQNH